MKQPLNVIIELNLEHPEQSQNSLETIEMITTPQYIDQQETELIDNIVHFVDSPISEMKHIDKIIFFSEFSNIAFCGRYSILTLSQLVATEPLIKIKYFQLKSCIS